MKMYDLMVTFSDKAEIEIKSFYTKKAVDKALKTLQSNQKIYGFKILSHSITTRPATQEEIAIHENHLKLMKKFDN